MKKTNGTAGSSRREILKLVGASVPVAAATVVVSPQEADAAVGETHADGLRSTAHTRKYFETARY